MFIKKISNLFNNINKEILKIMKYGLRFSFVICIMATAVLGTYLLFYQSNFLYLLGLNTFRLGLILGIEFIVCGLSVDAIKSYGL